MPVALTSSVPCVLPFSCGAPSLASPWPRPCVFAPKLPTAPQLTRRELPRERTNTRHTLLSEANQILGVVKEGISPPVIHVNRCGTHSLPVLGLRKQCFQGGFVQFQRFSGGCGLFGLFIVSFTRFLLALFALRFSGRSVHVTTRAAPRAALPHVRGQTGKHNMGLKQ